MDVKSKAALAVAHIKDPRAREIRFQALKRMFENLEKIKDHSDDESAFENGPSDYRNDNSDGVDSITPEQFQARLVATRTDLRKRARSMATEAELIEDGMALSQVAVETDPENDINRRGKYGYTPLIVAAIRGDFTECQRLKDAGARLDITDTSRKMAWEKARDKGFDSIADMLRPT